MYDGAPTHFSIAVRNHLYATYPGRWIGLFILLFIPCLSSKLPRPPSLGFLLQGLSEIACVLEALAEDLTARIIVASADIATQDLFERIRQSFVLLCRLRYDLT
ncbi:hypothetical protein TNCV_3118551 [Trichonephila clavipes]|uniref:Uncharacterized protein n=1 Tax=Trichonephila clavipes TaxID=2585209 RepID=A0A8X6W9D3_TRICX|nr:hypothetical protein TNCV_3118551 [Trichonephila clavipes]